MKLSRRCFLSLAAGGAAGTVLSPLPWKMMDDSAIWSQNWPWTPVPPDGEGTYAKSTCTLCPGGCGISVRRIDDRAIKIEGAEDHPLNDGGVCMLGLSGLQLLYGPNRIQAPLKRVGDRGQGRWQTISWEQAIGEVAHKLSEIRDRGTPQSVACIAPNDKGTVAQLLHRLLAAYGSPNFFRMPSIEDTYETAIYLTQGSVGSAGVDVENADFILSFGSAILDGYGSPVRMYRANSKLKELNGKVVQVEPRLSNTAAKADRWLAVKPGSEADLALAMAHAIIAEGAVNRDFIDGGTEGFEAFARMVQEKYPPEAVAEKTGLEAEAIIEVALQFAVAKRPLALFGKGKGQTPGSLKEALAVHALNALVGNINAEGGVKAMAAYDYIDWPEIEIDSIAAAGLQTPRLDGAGTGDFPHIRYLTHRLSSVAQEIELLMVAEANPCYSLPNSQAVAEALDKIPFVVSFSSFMDETAMKADLILPNHIYLERLEDVPVSCGVTQPLVGLCRPVVEPLYNTQHIGDSVIQIAKSLKGNVASAFPWKDYQACLKETLRDQWQTLEDKGYWTVSTPFQQDLESNSAKFVLMNPQLGSVYMADDVSLDRGGDSFPLTLIAYDSIRLTSRYIGEPPFMMKTVPDAIVKGQYGYVEINPVTAKKLGLANGQIAKLTTPVGEASVGVHYEEGIMPDLVAIPRGLGHTAFGRFLAEKGANANQLIGPVEDPASGLDAAWGIGAKLA
ncbi:MAG: molybdopterin-dependent oxidoreductase [Desulfobacteraceae bacterium]|jgi:anaerobic selenocysteine-containing dehydrogenase